MWFLIGIALLVIFYGIFTYNRLVSLSQQVKEARAGIATVLKQRFDLIPNLVETVKGYAKHEKEVFEKVTKFRSGLQDKELSKLSTKELADLTAKSTEILRSIMVVVENYPDLQASRNFLDLQESLDRIEEKLERARRFYNAVVRDYNSLVLGFPSNIIAGLFKFAQEDYFEVTEEERKAPQVKF